MIVFCSHQQIRVRAAIRPPEYVQELEAIIVGRSDHGVCIDISRPAYRELLRKYRGAANASHPQSEQHWQSWREDGGRWMPDGWLRPGFYTDSPSFGPLPGERLKSPGFEARCFRAAAEAGPVDVVIPLSVGSKHGDAELRYALRSIERYVENLGQVWIVGHRPTWLRGVEHIPAGDPHPSKDVNIIHKLLAACQAGVSERFVFWSDDQILLRPLAWSQLGPYTWRDLAGQPANGKRWHRRLLATRDWLASRGLPTWHCDTHVPIPMERSRFLELADAARDVWESGEGVTVGTWYCNQAAQPRPMGDRKATIEARLPTDQLHAAIAGRWFLGHNDAGFTSDLWALLDELFPDRCRFEAGERAARILVKPPGPSPSVIVPTISQPI